MVIASHMDTVAHASLTCKVLSAALERCGLSERDLKGVGTGNVLCSCEDCVRNAVKAAAETLGI